MSRGVSLCPVAQFDYCIALGAARSVRPVAYVWVLQYGWPPGPHWVLCKVFCWISSRFLWGYSTSALSIHVCSQCIIQNCKHLSLKIRCTCWRRTDISRILNHVSSSSRFRNYTRWSRNNRHLWHRIEEFLMKILMQLHIFFPNSLQLSF